MTAITAVDTQAVYNTTSPYIGYDKGMNVTFLIKWIIPSVCVAGYIGNGLILVVSTRKTFRHSAMGLYLFALAVADSIHLLRAFPLGWMDFTGRLDLQTNPIVCKIITVYTYSTQPVSSWILATITLERCVCVVKPFEASIWFSRRRAGIGLTLMLTIILGLHIHMSWTFGTYHTPNGLACNLYPNYSIEFQNVVTYLDTTLTTIGPFLMILTLNSVIIWKLVRPSTLNQSKHGGSKQRSLVIMLLVCSFAFIVLTAPILIVSIIGNDTKPGITSSKGVFFEVALVCVITNNSINFYLYCISGSRFREEVYSLFCPKISRRQGANSSSLMEMRSGRYVSRQESDTRVDTIIPYPSYNYRVN